MTKEEFMGFSSEAQHNMVLEALARVTKNIEIIENEPRRPFADTDRQRMNDIKLLTILAEAFGKNELVWADAEESKDNAKPVVEVVNVGKRTTLEEYVKEIIKESRGKYYGKEEK